MFDVFILTNIINNALINIVIIFKCDKNEYEIYEHFGNIIKHFYSFRMEYQYAVHKAILTM